MFDSLPIPSMGMLYLSTWTVDFYGFHVDKYISQVRSRSTSQLLEPWGLDDGDLWMLSWLSILDKKVTLLRVIPTMTCWVEVVR